MRGVHSWTVLCKQNSAGELTHIATLTELHEAKSLAEEFLEQCGLLPGERHE